METISVSIPIFDALPFPIAEAEINIRPQEDCAFPWGITADLTYQDPFTDKWHPVPEPRASEILEDIRKNDRAKWVSIERAAKENSRPDYDEPEHVYAA